MNINGKDLAAELKQFIESEEGNSLCDPTTIKATEQQRTYLENRIRHAFKAGVAWAETYIQGNPKDKWKCLGCKRVTTKRGKGGVCPKCASDQDLIL